MSSHPAFRLPISMSDAGTIIMDRPRMVDGVVVDVAIVDTSCDGVSTHSLCAYESSLRLGASWDWQSAEKKRESDGTRSFT
jgi:hypothetical protein